jgi:hypothetical protein
MSKSSRTILGDGLLSEPSVSLDDAVRIDDDDDDTLTIDKLLL